MLLPDIFSQRLSGVLLPLSSVSGNSCCGGLGVGAYRFADFLHRAGQRVWQFLPLNPVDECFSPYASISTFAADPVYIDLVDLVNSGFLNGVDLDYLPVGPVCHSAFHAANDFRRSVLRKAVRNFKMTSGTKYHIAREKFLYENAWVRQHALFCAASEYFGTSDWSKWSSESWRIFDEKSSSAILDLLGESVEYHIVLQLFFDVQWREFRDYCNSLGIYLVGDVPIYVSRSSVDTWSNRELFQIDSRGCMIRVAGVPADSFNPDGQRWNSPLYNWEGHCANDFRWWTGRIGNSMRRFDAVRLDHFIGFYNYFSLPLEPDPQDAGFWAAGPCERIFDAIFRELPEAKLIAEDLGVMNPGVRALRDKYNLPGINVFQFHFDFRKNVDVTLDWLENSVVCSGTHDTDTIAAWFDDVLLDRVKAEPFWDFKFLYGMIKEYIPSGVEIKRNTILWGIIRKIMSTRGNLAIFPVQDLLGLSTEARINFPGRAKGNWVWRVDGSLLTDELADRLASWTNESGRGK
ncbi:MAG: 4-alpha-glucanotransferase [Planctomycetaceae bacterium]|jgi:4-alpha-glucanotransferase|nr:4-alpha-glucanotransferase [Planctomycetaceae bacterium]